MSDGVSKLPVNLKLKVCKVNENITETNQLLEFFSGHLQTFCEEDS